MTAFMCGLLLPIMWRGICMNHIQYLEKQLRDVTRKLWSAYNNGNIELYEKYSKRKREIEVAIKLLKEAGI